MMDMARSVRLRLLAVVAALAVPPGCGGPTPQVYVLGDAVADAPATASQMNTPTIEVRPARVPDFLDTTDIVTRGAGGLIVPSQSGRWGERFSIGLTSRGCGRVDEEAARSRGDDIGAVERAAVAGGD